MRRLDKAVRAKGWQLQVWVAAGSLPQLVVATGDPALTYSRQVQARESYDRCAEVVLEALLRDKVLAVEEPD